MKRYYYVCIIIILSLAFSAANCSHSGDNGPHDVHLPKVPKSVSCQPGRWGGSIKLPLAGSPLTFNPILASTPDTNEITSKMFGTLLSYDYANQKPEDDGLATAIDAKPDGKSFVIHLREGASFSNGAPITADDVIFSFEVAMNPKLESIYSELMRVDGEYPTLNKDDILTVTITFPDHYEPWKLLFAKVPIISKSSLSEAYYKGNFRDMYRLDASPDQIVCSGPFVLKAYQPDKVELEYNHYYWKADSSGTALPYLTYVTYILKTPRQEQGYNLLTKNDFAVVEILPKDLTQFNGNDRFVAKDIGPSLHVWQLVMNWRADKNKIDPIRATWFRTPGFRWAMSQMIDRNQLVKDVFEGMAKPATTVIAPSNTTWFYDSEVNRKYDFNIEGARNQLGSLRYQIGDNGLLKDLGNHTVRFSIMHLNEYIPAQIAQRLIDDFKKIGIEAEADPKDAKTFWKSMNQGLYDVALVDSSPMFADPAFMGLYLNKHGKYFWFYEASTDSSFHGNMVGGAEAWMDRVDVSLNNALKKVQLSERREIYNSIQEEWAKNSPIIYLANPNVVVAAKSNIGNFKPANIDPMLTWNLDEFYLK